MSKQYDDYLEEHISNTGKGIAWLLENVPYVRSLTLEGVDLLRTIYSHDQSKLGKCEYEPYDNYFYGEKTPEVKNAFNLAWLHHIHENPHHWQHWILVHDDEPMEALEMPDISIIEMIADWWSFSWKRGNLFEIFDWYEKHKGGMILHPETRRKVETILNLMKEELSNGEDRMDENAGFK